MWIIDDVFAALYEHTTILSTVPKYDRILVSYFLVSCVLLVSLHRLSMAQVVVAHKQSSTLVAFWYCLNVTEMVA